MSILWYFGADICTYLGPPQLFEVQYSALPEAEGYIAATPALALPNSGQEPSRRHHCVQAFPSPLREGHLGMVRDPFEDTLSLQSLL